MSTFESDDFRTRRKIFPQKLKSIFSVLCLKMWTQKMQVWKILSHYGFISQMWLMKFVKLKWRSGLYRPNFFRWCMYITIVELELILLQFLRYFWSNFTVQDSFGIIMNCPVWITLYNFYLSHDFLKCVFIFTQKFLEKIVSPD